MNLYFLIPSVIFSALVAFFTFKVAESTKEVARCTREYTMETRHLWQITKKSYFVKATTGYLFEKYYKHIKEWPSVAPAWEDLLKMKWPPPEKQRPQIFRDDCHRVILEELFPEIKGIEKIVRRKLEEEGYKLS